MQSSLQKHDALWLSKILFNHLHLNITEIAPRALQHAVITLVTDARSWDSSDFIRQQTKGDFTVPAPLHQMQ